MRALLPYLTLYKRHKWMLTLGIVLAIVTLLASIGLLTLSGGSCRLLRWLASPGFTALTICSLPQAYAAQRSPAPRGVISNDWSAMTQHSVCCSICVFIPSANYCRSLCGPVPLWTG